MLTYVNPTDITNFLKTKTANRLSGIPKDMTVRTYRNRRYVGILIQDSSLEIGKPLEKCMHTRAMREHFCEGMCWEDTVYMTLYNKRYKREQSQGKRGGTDFKSFERQKLKPYDKIYRDIINNGFKQSNSIEENIEVAFDENGEILIIDGRHRLFLAQLLNISEIPVTINLISESLAKSCLINGNAKIESSATHDSLTRSINDNYDFVKRQLQTCKIIDRLKLLNLVKGGVRDKGVLKPPSSIP